MSEHPILAKMFVEAMKRLEFGTMRIITPEGNEIICKSPNEGIVASLIVKDWIFVKNLLARGSVGFGEDYIKGNWDTENLPDLLALCAQNYAVLDKFLHGTSFNRLVFNIINKFRENSRKQSKKNIFEHYDLGNDFYKLWLDKTMTYSSAIYDNAKTLEDAQIAKYSRILEKIKGKKQVLEIGCGWGGFAEEAIKAHKKITSLTISKAQLDYAKNRVKSKNVEFRLEDYRDTKGLYDAIVSIEMFEAVGEKYWPEYFKTISTKLKKDGKAIIQTITIADDQFADYRKRTDFIRQYTFPGGMLPSISRFTQEAEKSGLKCKEIFMFGQDYARTLSEWLKNFDTKKLQIKKLGYSEEFIRRWRFYLAYCIAGFATSRTNVIQAELEHA